MDSQYTIYRFFDLRTNRELTDSWANSDFILQCSALKVELTSKDAKNLYKSLTAEQKSSLNRIY